MYPPASLIVSHRDGGLIMGRPQCRGVPRAVKTPQLAHTPSPLRAVLLHSPALPVMEQAGSQRVRGLSCGQHPYDARHIWHTMQVRSARLQGQTSQTHKLSLGEARIAADSNSDLTASPQSRHHSAPWGTTMLPPLSASAFSEASRSIEIATITLPYLS